MPDTILFLMLFLGPPFALGAISLLVLGAEWAVSEIQTAVVHWQTRLERWRMRSADRSSRKASQEAFLGWLAAQAGLDGRDGHADQNVVDAHRKAELVRILVEEEVPKAIMRCVNTHRLMAQAAGACHYSEIAYEPECYQLRGRVVWLLAHTVAFLESYPLRLDDPRLLHNSILLRKRALPTCRRCPYIHLGVADAPALCPTAELVEIKGATGEKAV